LCAKLIRAVTALEGDVGYFPETLRVKHYAKLPYQPDCKCNEEKRGGIETGNEQKRRKHHQMIPVKNAASSAAFILHNQSKRTPDQDADQIAHIKSYADQEYFISPKNLRKI
jgi:hypothetical protein